MRLRFISPELQIAINPGFVINTYYLISHNIIAKLITAAITQTRSIMDSLRVAYVWLIE